MNLQSLHNAIAAVAPITGVSADLAIPKAQWVIFFQPSATPAQIAAAQTVLANWVEDYSTAIRTELLRRVEAVIPPKTMTTLIVFYLANILTTTDKSAISDAANWLKAMAANAKTLITANSSTYALDSNWTAVPATVAALVAAYTV